MKTIERRRFINAVKSIPNCQAVKNTKPQQPIVKIYLGNEEKEQMKQFNSMKTNVNKKIKIIETAINQSKIHVKKVNVDINAVCNQLIQLVDQLRSNLLKQVS